MQDYHVGRKLAAETRQSQAERRANPERDDLFDDGHDEDYDTFDMEQNAWKKRQDLNHDDDFVVMNHFPTDDTNKEDEPDGIYTFSNKFTTDFGKPFRYPTTEKNTYVDLSVLHSNKAMNGAAILATKTYMDVIGNSTVDQRVHCRQQRLPNVDDLKAWSLPNSISPRRKALALPTPSKEAGGDHNEDEDEDDDNHDLNRQYNETSLALTTYTFQETRVTLYTNALMNDKMRFRPRIIPRGTPPDAVGKFPCVHDVSFAYGLKHRQHVAFVTMAQALLTTWRSREDYNLSNSQSLTKMVDQIGKDQLLLYLYGCGGTGKSHVIDAVHAFCIAWEKPGALAKTAMTGKAAVGINGVTLHKWIGMHWFAPSTSFDEQEAITKGIPGFTEDLGMLVIDEESMQDKQKIVRLDFALRSQTKTELPFGGLHVVHAGDKFQLPPPVGEPIHRKPVLQDDVSRSHLLTLENEEQTAATCSQQEQDPDSTRADLLPYSTTTSRKRAQKSQQPTLPLAKRQKQSPGQQLRYREFSLEGFQLWRLFTKVVILDENVRFESDPEYGEELELSRKGTWTDEFMDMINSRQLPNDGYVEFDESNMSESQQKVAQVLLGGRNVHGEPDGSNPVFVTPDNETRTQIIIAYTKYLAGTLPDGHYPIRIVAKFHCKKFESLSEADISHIMSMSHTQTCDLPPYIDLVPGMPILFTMNVNGEHGIANGTFGRVHSIQFPPETRFTLAQDAGSEITVLFPNRDPMVVLVRAKRDPSFPPMPVVAGYEDLPPDIYPVFMMKAFQPATVNLTPAVGGPKRTISIRLQQVPFVCAIASTVYKVQGETLTSLVVAEWYADSRSGRRKKNNWQQAYITLSRVVNRNSLAVLKPFTKKHAQFFKPPQELLDEDKRLHDLCHKYLSSDEVQSMFSANDYRPPPHPAADDSNTTTLKPPSATLPSTTTSTSHHIPKPKSTNLVDFLRSCRSGSTAATFAGTSVACEDKEDNAHASPHHHNSPQQKPTSTKLADSISQLFTPASNSSFAPIMAVTPEDSQTNSLPACSTPPSPTYDLDVPSPFCHHEQQGNSSFPIEIDDDNNGFHPDHMETTITNATFFDQALNTLLTPRAWLNDSAIDFHLRMIIDRHERSPCFRYLSSLFFSNMLATSFADASLHRWIDSRLNISSLQNFSDISFKLFIPINENGNHWILAFIDFQHHSYGYYDSLQHCIRQHISNALQMLLLAIHRHMHPLQPAFDVSLWANLSPSGSIPGPTQTNGYDCGVYISLAARHLLEHNVLSNAFYSEHHMPEYRQLIADELIAYRRQQLHHFQLGDDGNPVDLL
jgi:hypothetical protein